MTCNKHVSTKASRTLWNAPLRKISAIAVGMVFCAACVPASAQDAQGWYMHLGIADVAFSERADISAGGNKISGASASLSDSRTLGLGVGYRFSNDTSLIGILGVPPKTTVKGTGPLSGVTVGDITYGPLIFAANYHVPTAGAFQPFIGAGVSYTRIFEAEGDDIAGLSVDDAFGKVLRVGFDYMLDDRNGVFFSANKIFTSAKADGRAPAFGGAPIEADIDLNPLILHLGWTRRF